MSTATEEVVRKDFMAFANMHGTLSSMTPWEIRIAIAELVREGRMDLAVAAVESAMALHPDSEDILVIGSLLAEVRQDWSRAEHLLIQLLQIQGSVAPSEGWMHLIRVLRCQNKTDDMVFVIDHVLNVYGNDAKVIAEREALVALKSEFSNSKA